MGYRDAWPFADPSAGYRLIAPHGGVAEWLIAPALKAGKGLRSFEGSNPSPSAKRRL